MLRAEERNRTFPGLVVFGLIVLVWQLFLLVMAFFEPSLRYGIDRIEAPALDSERFLQTLEALTDAQINHRSSVAVLTNGEQFYEAELEAIQSQSINLEAYIFQRGEVASRFLEALTERARAGVRVNVTLDAIGSFSTTKLLPGLDRRRRTCPVLPPTQLEKPGSDQ